MENREKSIIRMLRRDRILLLVCWAAVCCTILFALLQALPLTEDHGLKTALVVICVTGLLVISSGLLTVLRNLTHHKSSVYEEDLFYLEQMRKRKEEKQT